MDIQWIEVVASKQLICNGKSFFFLHSGEYAVKMINMIDDIALIVMHYL